IEHLHEVIGCRALFATHYHELTGLDETLTGIANISMRVHQEGRVHQSGGESGSDDDADLVFLHEVVAGAADRSYGIHVARLAGLPTRVISRARAVLSALEDNEHKANSDKSSSVPPPSIPPLTEEPEPDPLLEAITQTDPDTLTPREALERLYYIKGLSKDLSKGRRK
ncbi:MAG: hypothetical protein HAW65_06005, partial [Alphaproteobacteria bacterium]|nr:hypothetical protein [Alphaproteobacteria bacterium]